jgi:GTPase KRas protein
LDTAGQEEYKALRDQYMRSASGFLMVYSVIDRKTFEEINDFHSQILRVKDADNFPMVVVGNKCDLESERVISIDEGKNYAKSLNIGFMETSARARKNVDEAFHELVREVRKAQSKGKNDKEKKTEKKKGGGCMIL